MGKRKKLSKKVSAYSVPDDRDKIRDSILQVFRTRLSSPNKGGGLLVGPAPGTSKGKRTHGTYSKHRSCTADHEQRLEKLHNSSMSEVSSTPDKSHTRRWRTRSERNRERTKDQEKAGTSSTTHSRSNSTCTRSSSSKAFSVITHNRLTSRLGLFNRGKKSDRIERDVRIPESVKKKAEADLKHILNIPSNGPECMDIASDQDINTENRYSSQASNDPDVSNTIFLASTPCSQVKGVSCYCTSTASSLSETSSMCSLKIQTPVVKENAMPESPPMEEIAKGLLTCIHPRKLFPGQYYLMDVLEDLKRHLRHNAPRSTTPERTPNGSMSSEVVRRSLLRSFTPNQGIGAVTVQPRPNHLLMDSKNCTRESTCNAAVQHGDVYDLVIDSQTETQTLHPNMSSIEKNMPFCNIDNVVINTEISKPSCIQAESNSQQEMLLNYSDARSLLAHNDSIIASKANHNDSSSRPSEHRSSQDSKHQQEQHQHYHQKDLPRAPHRNMNYSSCHSYAMDPRLEQCTSHSQSSEFSSQTSSGYYTGSLAYRMLHGAYASHDIGPGFYRPHVPNTTDMLLNNVDQRPRTVLTVFPEHPAHVPQYIGDYHSVKDSHVQCHAVPLQTECMDILDMLDSQTTSIGTRHLRQSYHHSDISPLWLPPSPTLPQKPSLDTPSPPDTMYPHRLY